MFRRTRYQQGSLTCVKRKTGQAVWVFRWYEPITNGGMVYRKKVLGTTEELKTESQAQRAAEALRLTINSEQTPKSVSYGDATSRSIDNHIVKLRHKLEPDPACLTHFQNCARYRIQIRSVSLAIGPRCLLLPRALQMLGNCPIRLLVK